MNRNHVQICTKKKIKKIGPRSPDRGLPCHLKANRTKKKLQHCSNLSICFKTKQTIYRSENALKCCLDVPQTSVKCSTEDPKAEAELRSVWTKPLVSWYLSDTFHRLVSFSREYSTRARYNLFTTTMSTDWDTGRRTQKQNPSNIT